MGDAETQGGMTVASSTATGASVGGVPGAVVGLAVGLASAGLTMGGAHDRAVRQRRVHNEQMVQERQYGNEQAAISDNLRRAMENVANQHGMNLTEFLSERNSPLRTQVANQVAAHQAAAAQSGMDRALAALQAPAANLQMAPSAPLAQSTATNEQRLHPGLQAALDQISNQGYLKGASGFDTQNQQNLDLANAPLSNDIYIRQLLAGVQSAESNQFNNLRRQALGQAAIQADQAGGGKMLAGGVISNLANAIGAYYAAQPGTTVNPNTGMAANAGATDLGRGSVSYDPYNLQT